MTIVMRQGAKRQSKTKLHLQCIYLIKVSIVISFGVVIVGVGIIHVQLLKLESNYIKMAWSDGGVGMSDLQGTILTQRQFLRSKDKDGQERPTERKHSLFYEQYMNNSFVEIQNNKHDQISFESNYYTSGRGIGSRRGNVVCDTNITSLVSYWSDPRSEADRVFLSPFSDGDTNVDDRKLVAPRYLSFEPDPGGWNNIRMEFEIMVVLAAATGRTLILPPDYPLYLLQKDASSRHRGLQDFLQYEGKKDSHSSSYLTSGFDNVIETIKMQEFFQKEIFEKKSYSLPTDETNRTKVINSIEKCNYRAKQQNSCIHLFDHLANIADFTPDWDGEKNCLIMDDLNWFKTSPGFDKASSKHENIKRFCNGRSPVYYNKLIHNYSLLHFRTHSKDTRLLVHFYAFVYFTNPRIGNYFKRLVRDRVRYNDAIFCAGGKIVKALLDESTVYSGERSGSYSSMHIRRGDFQWPKMRISATEWYENTRHLFRPKEIIYIATDETNVTFFEPLAKHYRLRYLSDYFKLASLDQVDPNFVGMIDQVVASRSREFVGTFFSSFSAYIGRMRGYHGMSGLRMHYGDLKHMNATHRWVYPHSSYSAREFPLGWISIDSDSEANENDFH